MFARKILNREANWKTTTGDTLVKDPSNVMCVVTSLDTKATEQSI
jgi:hypothetical protein